MRPDELERRLRARLDALGPAPRAELLHVLILPDIQRAEDRRVLVLPAEPDLRRTLLIDCEDDRVVRVRFSS
jgi:hypothetical protein